jgi:hypothetical protein
MYCAPPIQNCLTYDTTSTILACSQCAVTYYYNTVTRQCLVNNNYDPYCQQYDSNQVCIRCTNGYYYDSILKVCTADSAEYVARSQCATFSQTTKDTCVACNNYNVLLNVNNTCKLPSTTVSATMQTALINCDQHYVDFQGAPWCSTAKEYVPDGFTCDPTTAGCFPNSLNLTSGLAVSIATNMKLSNCITYASSFEGATVPCKQCRPTAQVIEWLYTSDICAASSRIPWCPDDSRDVETKICNFPGNFCTMFYYNGATFDATVAYTGFDLISTCTRCPTAITYDPACFRICLMAPNNLDPDPISSFARQVNGVGTACNGPSSTYYCKDINPAATPNIPCKTFVNIQCGFSGVYLVAWTYPVQLAPDNSQCVIEDIYYNPAAVCLVVKNFSCLLCIRGFYPVRTLQVQYTQDYIESYYAGLALSNTKNCMMYDATRSVCTRCDFAATGQRLNTYGTCIDCNTAATSTDPTNTLCISFFSATLIYGSCFKVDPYLVPSPCLQCMSNFFNIYSFEMDWSRLIQDIDYIYSSFQTVTYIANPVNAFAVVECAYKDQLFVNAISLKSQNAFCEWGYSVSSVYYCLKCVFGYVGNINQTSSGVFYLQNCTTSSLCNNDVYYTFNITAVRYYLSCHVCINTINIPTLYMYHDSAVSASAVKFLFSNTATPSGTTFNCGMKFNTLAPACAVQMFINDAILLAKVGGNAWLCLSCLPGYSAISWAAVADGRYPYFYVTGCTAIQNCADSNITNSCQQCIPNYNLQNNSTQCVRSPVQTPDLQYCNVIQVIGLNTICASCMNGYKYLQVPSSTDRPAFKCLPYVVANCEYYSVDACIQSVKKIGVGFNIIIRKTFTDYYINQSNCNSAQSYVSNCLFYLNATSCYLCSPGFHVGGPFRNFCYVRNDPNCNTWNDVTQKCQTCVSGYTFNGVTCLPSTIPLITVVKCIEYSGQYCSKCEVGFTPIVVGNGITSICVSNKLSSLCEVVNDLGIQVNAVLSCTTCKKITDVQDALTAKTLTLDQFDFVDYSDYQTYLSTGNIAYSSSVIGTLDYVRASIILQQRGASYCQGFGGVPNCVRFDANDLTHSFVCLTCNVAGYYLQSGNCIARTPIANCIAYYPTINDCQTYLDAASGTISYSVKDNQTRVMTIPQFPGFNSNPNSIPGCTAWGDQNTCAACNSSMWLYDNLCLTVQSTVPNCVQYLAEGICSQCATGMLLLQNKCLIIYVSNCNGYLTNTKCLRCSQNFPVLSGSGSCVTNIDIPNCLVYDAPGYCYQCSSLYVNMKGVCAFGKLIKNCINNFAGECRECLGGYMVSSDKKNCITNPNYDRNCDTFANSYYCVVCQERHFVYKGQCVACQTNELSCYLCDPSSPTRCLLCNPGFFMNQAGRCQIVVGYIPPPILLLNQNNALQSVIGSRRIR